MQFKNILTPLCHDLSQYFDRSAWEIILLDKNIGLPPNNAVADAKINKIVVTYLLQLVKRVTTLENGELQPAFYRTDMTLYNAQYCENYRYTNTKFLYFSTQ